MGRKKGHLSDVKAASWFGHSSAHVFRPATRSLLRLGWTWVRQEKKTLQRRSVDLKEQTLFAAKTLSAVKPCCDL